MNQNADWKHFKYVRELALQRLCERALNDMVETASNSSVSHHERYLAVYRKIKDYDKQIASAFNILSRSRMLMQLVGMYRLNLIEESEVDGFSAETIDQLKRMASI